MIMLFHETNWVDVQQIKLEKRKKKKFLERPPSYYVMGLQCM